MNKSILHKILKYVCDLWCDFTENQRFFGKWLISDNFIMVACARARAHPFSGNIYPIDLKFSEMVYYVKIKDWTKVIRIFLFFL